MARLKAAPKLPGWDSAEDRRNFDARRRRGRLIFLLVLLIFAWIYAPRYCVHEEEDYFDMLTANISGIGRTCDERAEEARLSYVAALFGNETAVPLGSDGGGQAARGCPNEARRVVADMPRLGGELLMDVATDVEEKSYALVEGVLGRTEAEAARRAALVVAGTLLDQAIEGVSAESFRIPISLEPTSFTERFREALLGPFADRRAVKLRLAREKLSAAASFAQEKIEPVASAVLGSHALVETSLAVYNTADDLAFMQTSTNSLFTSTISLQPFETVAELVNNLSDNCLKNQSVPAGSAVLTTQAASKDQGTAKELKFAIRLSYADVGSLALPSPVFVADAPRLEYYATQRQIYELKTKSFSMKTFFADDGKSIEAKLRAGISIAFAFIKKYATEVFYACLVLAAVSAIASLHKLVDAEQGALRRSDELDDEDILSDDEKREEADDSM